MKNKIVATIPARFDSQRFPGKMMKPLGKYPLIVQTYLSVVKTKLFDKVWVITDSQLIFDELKKHKGNVLMSKKKHDCGSDRIAEMISKMDADIIINIQGDEPFIDTPSLKKLIQSFKDSSVSVATLKQQITQRTDIENPNVVKVITTPQGDALYFSRSPIPYQRNQKQATMFFRHVGIYAFRKQALQKFYKQKLTPLENAEQIEAIRYLEMGLKMRVIPTSFVGLGIDTEQDLLKAQKIWKEK